jgi:hypothetical protein
VTRLGQLRVGLYIILWTLLPASVHADMKRLLHGIDTVNVAIERLHPDLALGGVTPQALREEIVANLQKAGLQVSSLDGRSVTTDRPQLSLSVNITPIENFPMYSVFITLKLRQNACLTNNLIICEPVITWEDASAVHTLSVSQLTDMRQEVRTLITRFVSAYLEENPKR